MKKLLVLVAVFIFCGCCREHQIETEIIYDDDNYLKLYEYSPELPYPIDDGCNKCTCFYELCDCTAMYCGELE